LSHCHGSLLWRTLASPSTRWFRPSGAIDRTTVFDLFAAYKLFLRRSPENFDVVENRVGASTELLFKDFLVSGEFLAQEVYWPSIVDAATKVIELNKAKQAASAEQAVQPAADASPVAPDQQNTSEA
jgi:hypothetical protein